MLDYSVYKNWKCDIKVGSTELSRLEFLKYYSKGKYIVNYSGIWKLIYSPETNSISSKKISNEKGIARKGRFYALDSEYINEILEYKAIEEENITEERRVYKVWYYSNGEEISTYVCAPDMDTGLKIARNTDKNYCASQWVEGEL